MTTATSLWLSAGVGIAAGAGQIVLLVLASIIALCVLGIAGVAERRLPKRGSDEAAARDLRLPNRRGAIAENCEAP